VLLGVLAEREDYRVDGHLDDGEEQLGDRVAKGPRYLHHHHHQNAAVVREVSYA
jgi:hypothetical protein